MDPPQAPTDHDGGGERNGGRPVNPEFVGEIDRRGGGGGRSLPFEHAHAEESGDVRPRQEQGRDERQRLHRRAVAPAGHGDARAQTIVRLRGDAVEHLDLGRDALFEVGTEALQAGG